MQLPVDRTLQANIHYMFDGQNLGVLPIGGCHQSIDRDLDDITVYNYPLRLRLPLWITIPHRPFLTMARMDLCGNESPIGSIENIDFSLPLAI